MATVAGESIFGRGARLRPLASAVALAALTLLALVVPAAPARAADSPSAGDPVYFQTQGPDEGIGFGDYYSASVAQGGAGTDHLITFATPMFWPSALPITVAIYDPESWGGVLPSSGLAAGDEGRTGPDSTSFSVVERPSGATVPADPRTTTYAAAAPSPASAPATHGRWDHLATFIPTPGSTYEIHVSTAGDDQNSWRARISYDEDCAVGEGTCAADLLDNGNEIDDVDGFPGTGDELYLNAVRVAYQHDSATNVCNNHFFFVPDTMASVTMRNFDLDLTGQITYTRGDGSSVSGTPSASGVWATDTIPVGAGQSGWWTAQFCYNATNLYVFESTQNLRLYMDDLPGAPALSVTKTDGVTTAQWGDSLDYTIDVANTSNTRSNPGSAVGVVVRDTVPAGLDYETCSMGGAAGSCAESGGVVTWTLTDPIAAGATVRLGISTTVRANVTGTVINTATADFNDVYGNNYPDVSGSDAADTIEPPRLTVTKTSNTGGALVSAGAQVDYTVVVTNSTLSGHTGVTVTDALPRGTTYVPGSTRVTVPAAGAVTAPAAPLVVTATDSFTTYGPTPDGFSGGTGWTGPWTETIGMLCPAPGYVYRDVPLRALMFGWEGCGIERTVNVVGKTSASLSFQTGAATADPMESGDSLEWGVRVDGGAFTRVGSVVGAPSPNPGTVTLDLSSFLPANTLTVAFRAVSGITGAGEWYSIDDVVLSTGASNTASVLTNAPGGTLSSGIPATLVTAADGVSLPAGSQMTVTYSVIVDDPIASPTQRFLANTALATSTEDPAGSEGTVIDQLDRTPVLAVDKTGPASALLGDTVTYDFSVSHAPTSDGSPVSAVTISDDVAGSPTYASGDDGDGLLEADETWHYSVDYTISNGDPHPLINTATIGGTDLNGQAIPTATASHSTAVIAPVPSISLTKVTAATDLVAGEYLIYTLTATNTGNVSLYGVNMTDALPGAAFVGPCGPVNLMPGARLECSVSYSVTPADVAATRVTNNATVTATSLGGMTVFDTATVTVTGAEPDRTPILAVQKTGPDSAVVGDQVMYTFTVSHAPASDGSPVSAVTLVDDVTGTPRFISGDDGDVLLESGETWVYAVDYVVAISDPSPLVNTATVGGTDLDGQAIPAATARHSMDVIAAAPSISLTKTTAATGYVVGDTIVYTLTATNTGNVALSDVTLTDSLPGATFVGSCAPVTLQAGAQRDCTVSYTASAADVAVARVINDAAVTGTPATGPAVSDTATVTVTGSDSPHIGVVVTVDSRNYFVAGQALRFKAVATNTGPITLHHSQLEATLPGADTADCDALDEVLLPGESMTCYVDYVVKAPDMDVTELVLSVVATGESSTAVSVTATGRRNTVPVIALAFTGVETRAHLALASILLLAGTALLIVTRRRRDRRSS